MEKFSGIYKSLLFFLLCGGFHNLLIAQTTDVFSTPGTYNWTVPPCVTSITLDVWAGGGGGGAVWSQFTSASSGPTSYELCTTAGGGGGGGYVRRTYTVTPGQVYTIVVGAGGNGGTVNSSGLNRANNGSSGGNSTFSGSATTIPGTLTAFGGSGGGAANFSESCLGGCSGANHKGSNGTGGSGGSGSNGTTTFTGGLGATGVHSGSTNDKSGAGGGGAGTLANGGNASGTTTAGAGGTLGGGNGGSGNVQSFGGGYLGTNGQPGNTLGGGGGGASGHNRQSNSTTSRSNIGGNGARGEVRITYPTPGSDLVANGIRLAPSGPQCSGTVLNFDSNPTGGNGSYVYSWSTTPASTTSATDLFSPNLVNNGCADVTYTINLSVTSCGVTTTQTFTPTIKPVPTISLGATVNCSAATVFPSGALLCGVACPSCSYSLQSCSGCLGPSTPVGTTNTSGTAFTLYGASSAGFSATLNGCSSGVQSLNLMAAPYNCSTPLAAELGEFSVKCLDGTARLDWVVLSEFNNSHYTIDHSLDGIIYENKSIIEGYGTITDSRSYSFTDSRPSKGVSYYKLSQTDFDGKTENLGVLLFDSMCDTEEERLIIYPNPTDGDVNISFSHDRSEDFSIKVFNAMGQLVIPTVEEEFTDKGLTMLKVKTIELSKGIYIIKVVIGENEFIEKLVVKK